MTFPLFSCENWLHSTNKLFLLIYFKLQHLLSEIIPYTNIYHAHGYFRMGNIETLSPFNSSDLPSFQVIDIRSEAILEAWEIQGAAFGFLYVEKAQERLFTIIFLEFILISLQSRLNNKWRTYLWRGADSATAGGTDCTNIGQLKGGMGDIFTLVGSSLLSWLAGLLFRCRTLLMWC